MRLDEVLTQEDDIEEWKASKALCKSNRSNGSLGASALASCKSQGYRSREGGKIQRIGKKRVRMSGKKLKGQKYGGPIIPNKG
jgi:hypothetical protein